MKDHYSTLGLEAGASEEEVRRAYKKLAMQHHPDRGGNAAEFQQIQEAYSTLSDPGRRAEWEQQQAFANMGGQPGGFNFSFNFGPDINDILRGFHGNHPFGNFRSVKNRDLRIKIEVDLASTLEQQEKHIEVRHQDGSTRTVQITIPRGVQTGMQMRCPSHGDHSMKTQPPGDLYVDFFIINNRGFHIDGINLVRQVKLNCIDAIMGTEITVHGLDHKQFNITIPKSTQHGTMLKIAQQGLWDINQPIRGDLLVHVELDVPTRITSEQLARLQKFI
jgi:DnaJ-class molecular chaperone